MTALTQSGISRISSNYKVIRVKNYSMTKIDESLVYVCNAIVLNTEIIFNGAECMNKINFN
jgi:hypothetical protein